MGRLEDAAAVFREQIKISPQSSQPYLLLGLILRQQNKIDEARKAFENAQRLAPENLLAFSQLVDLDIESRDFATALQRVQAELQKTPQSPAAHFLEGKVYAAQGQWDRAEAALLKTLELDPNSSSAYDLLISTYVAANKLPQAITQLESLLSKSPDNARALMLSALIYEKMNEFAKARDAYEKLLSAKPDFPPVLNNLAYLYAERLDELDKAHDLAQKARALQPGDAAIADTLGWILYKRGDYKQALALLQESAQNLPNNPEIQFHLGMASYMMGRTDEARTAFRQAAAAPADFPGKEEAKRRLSLLGDVESKEKQLSSNELEVQTSALPNGATRRSFDTSSPRRVVRKARRVRPSGGGIRKSDHAESQPALSHREAGSTVCRPVARQREGSQVCQEGERARTKRPENRRHSGKCGVSDRQFHLGLQPSPGKCPPAPQRCRNPLRFCLGCL